MIKIPIVDTPSLSAAAFERMVSAIITAIDPMKIVLFGSYARKDSRPDSDLDLLIIQSNSAAAAGDRRHTVGNLLRLLADVKLAKDILVYSEDEVSRWSTSLNHVVATALREGVVVYER